MTCSPHWATVEGLARAKLTSTGALPPGASNEEAVQLLAELYAVGTRHGITPERWSLVGSLGRDCVDVLRVRDRFREAQRERAEASRRLGSSTPTLAEDRDTGRGR